ncbi:MAG: acylneuraminate cytidylyltransferase family protein [Betaproteobacteria bacterium]|nr:acylneuraminate cytidylyltransferase family protein [Betaproteobacteria bacterium]
MKAVCLIPARGGSKRLPRKNIADFLGKPIIAYTIEAAIASGLFERVVVSTEDAEIAAVAARFGAIVHQRPRELASDTARVIDVCLDFLDEEERRDRKYDVFGCLLATAPMRGTADIRAVFNLIEPGRCEFALATTTYDLPPLQALRQDADGALAPMWPDLVNLRSQEAPQLCVDNGSTYFATVAAFRAQQTFYAPGLRGHPMPRERSVAIDEPADLALALFHAQKLGL